MSYQVLARKWRPRDFTTLVGQEHVVRALTHALEQQRLHHAYLFTGTRGVGKTTLSRILAKSLNCVGADGQGGITAQPCGVCRACTEIDAGRFVDYIEMDAASNRGVDEMAQLLDRAVYAPTVGRFKVYMIDEVHMLTNHAFNAMLKTLEEPPEHVKFILATTDPQKIPVTVLSRCLQFNLKQMPPGHIVSHLEHILGEEHIAHEANALRLLAAAAQGSMRDALSLTDQAIAYSAGEVSEAAVRGMLGAIDQSYLVRLLDALADENGAGLVEIADEMAGRSLSFSGALQDLASLLQKIALAQVVPAAVQDDWPEADDVRRLAERFDAQSVQLFYQFANLGRNELALAPDEYAGFTMTLLRMLAFQPGQSGGDATPPSGGGGKRVVSSPAASVPAASPRPTMAASAPAVAPVAQTTSAARPEPVVEAPRATYQVSPSAPAAVAPAVETPAAAPTSAPARRSPAMEALAAARQASSRGRGGASAPAATPVAAPAPVARPVAAAGPRPNPVAAPASPPPRREPRAASAASPDDGPPPWDEMPGEFASPSLEEIDAAFAGWDSASNARPGASAPATGSAPVEPPAVAPVPVQAKPVAPEPVAAAMPPDLSASSLTTFDGDWPKLAASLPMRGLAQQLAHQSELVAVEGVTVRLRVPLPALTEAGVVERLEAALTEHFGTPIRVACDIGAARATAAAADAELRAQRQRDAEDAIAANPFVQALVRDFAAQVVPGSIQPHAH
ncbi:MULTISPECIES: DNA polymerase III subunit gamma/tau [Ralstonia]|uniref:DNA polymerase III subunit gamma/tau n=1 Tax=Ralstonia TaxID=48736 RepID=UPI00038618EB|nr:MULTISPECIES: DNA polymerase III subunit gamma/tau [Ralstonia]EPX98438.1 DNA polymerase III subunit gamma/tau [Ralstonia sp. AU12-08]MBY4704583.1 DNA polymerase III subunit gamma/tau [Ralstonia insidiosa]